MIATEITMYYLVGVISGVLLMLIIRFAKLGLGEQQ